MRPPWFGTARGWRALAAGAGAMIAVLVGGCTRPDPDVIQGYVEGEFVYVASPFGGALESLAVQRGDVVDAGAPLFALDPAPEKEAREEADRRLTEAKARWEDTKKGKRPTELASIEAQLSQARSSLEYSEKELERQLQLLPTKGTPQQQVDRAKATRDMDRDRVAQLEADLRTARLGSRDDQIAAAEADVRAQQAALAQADWNLAEKRQAAPRHGLVYDTLYRAGEWVGPGKPVIMLLPPELVKVRVFVPQERLAAIHAGQEIRVSVDGVPQPFTGKVSFISPRAEFTPPVVYTRESRAKLVFRVELVFEPDVASKLHPGQPVDVRLPRP